MPWNKESLIACDISIANTSKLLILKLPKRVVGLSVHSKYIHLAINLTVSEHQVERSVPPVATYWRLVPDNNLLNTFLAIDDVNHGILWKHIS